MTDNANPNAEIVTTRAHTARIWDYWLGGKDHYTVDREIGQRIQELHPGIIDYAHADRAFLRRAIRHLTEEAGIRQFLDIGTGLPTANNTHEVAQRFAPESRVVYVDNDPLVLVHARALLSSAPEGVTDYLDADLRDVNTILTHAARTLDLTQPVALVLLGVVIFIEDDDEAFDLVHRLLERLPSGSYLVLSHTVIEPDVPDMEDAVAYWNQHGTPKLSQRHPSVVADFFAGTDLIEPGLVSCSRWRPTSTSDAEPAKVAMYGGVGRKP